MSGLLTTGLQALYHLPAIDKANDDAHEKLAKELEERADLLRDGVLDEEDIAGDARRDRGRVVHVKPANVLAHDGAEKEAADAVGLALARPDEAPRLEERGHKGDDAQHAEPDAHPVDRRRQVGGIGEGVGDVAQDDRHHGRQCAVGHGGHTAHEHGQLTSHQNKVSTVPNEAKNMVVPDQASRQTCTAKSTTRAGKTCRSRPHARPSRLLPPRCRCPPCWPFRRRQSRCIFFIITCYKKKGREEKIN